MIDHYADHPSPRGGAAADGGDLHRQLRALRSQWWIIALCALAAAAAAYAYTASQPATYDATARLLLQGNDLGSTVTGLGQAQVDPEREAATALALAEQPLIATRVIDELELALDPEELQAKVAVVIEGNSRLMAITATEDTARTATRLANEYAEQYIGFRRDTERAEVQRALESVNEQLEGATAAEDSIRITDLTARRNQLQTLEGLQTGGVQLIQQATGQATLSSPSAVRAALLGLFVGLLLGGALAFLRSRLDRRLKSADDVIEILGPLPVLATIPRARGRRSGTLQSEGFRALLTSLAFLDPDRALRSILVTSATMDEGKTTTSINLALSFAERNESVLVLEGDLRRRGLSRQLDLLDHAGVSEILAGEGTLADYAVVVPPGGGKEAVGARATGSGPTATRTLSGAIEVVPAGRAGENSHALLTSDRVRRLLDGAREMADNVIVDGTPLGLLNDMLPVAARVDTVIIVVHLDRTRRNELTRLADRLRDARIDPVGIVLFGTSGSEPAYGAYVN